ncbi:oligopeptide/dipeptide ABC transporter ATP-binding protein [Actibacterium sp. MT2.3-13A]|uniref:ABC transporter ATP-binding protein n=1 Tax=Actibacterium sp. MT2.3-13A TaxID=2828332 RepID=UPI001BADC2F3|nr:oligopeptide/dipeptide ABC transporter ATP-binding protein [Actibacterium sp. MT2.3-13A]
MSRPDIILETRALKRRFVTHKPLFGAPIEVRAVDGIDLSIRRGETFAIVGESGCGKSTLARMLVRLIDPSEGAVIYDNKDISKLGQKEMRALRSDLQFIFQDPFSSLNPRMTVGALIEEPLRAHGIGTREERRVRVADLLSRVGLMPQHADRYPHEFSGGQRQRIGIARALAASPKVLIGDEPVSALDVSIQAQVVNLLEDLKEEFGLTLIIIAHDLAVIRHMADRVGVMYLGELVEVGPVDEIFANPRHPYTEALIAAIPVPRVGARAKGHAVEGDPPNPIAPPPGCRFHPRCPYAEARCRQERPRLAPIAEGESVACHRHEELSLNGLVEGAAGRAPAAEKRFNLYRAARATSEGAKPSDNSPPPFPSNKE